MAALLQKDAGLHWDSKKLAYGSKLVAVRPVGVDATVVELKGKEHWWWDTKETNDVSVSPFLFHVVPIDLSSEICPSCSAFLFSAAYLTLR